MREQVEIGRGRSAHRGYTFDDLDIVPSRRTRSSSQVSTAWQLDAYRLELPLLTHPTDAIVSPDTAARVGELGGLGVLNAEGLWARHAEADRALADVAARAATDPADAVAFTRELPAFDRLRVKGIMTLALFSDDHALVGRCFERMVQVQRELRDVDGGGWDELSMGCLLYTSPSPRDS